VYPGVDTLFVSFGTLLGGDCTGYTDSLGVSYPDNVIDAEDMTKVKDAFLATPDSSQWDYDTDPVNGKVNWKWADINEDDVVEEDDLSLITANLDETGAQPRYKPVVDNLMPNQDAVIEFMNVPDELTAGETYTIQVIASNTSDVRAYFVNLTYDRNALAFAGITTGDFFDADSYSFPVVRKDTVGLVNSMFGNSVVNGDGILANVTFTAVRDGKFSPDMLGIRKASIVNSAFMKENIAGKNPTVETANGIPATFMLGQNYPNPFNPTTTISFSLPEANSVTLKVYDILGRLITTLVDEVYAPGNYSVVWNATDMNGKAVSAGVYFYTINAGKYHSTQRMLLMK
jgi:hypothetical protein